jgi:hypothetical protein
VSDIGISSLVLGKLGFLVFVLGLVRYCCQLHDDTTKKRRRSTLKNTDTLDTCLQDHLVFIYSDHLESHALQNLQPSHLYSFLRCFFLFSFFFSPLPLSLTSHGRRQRVQKNLRESERERERERERNRDAKAAQTKSPASCTDWRNTEFRHSVHLRVSKDGIGSLAGR